MFWIAFVVVLAAALPAPKAAVAPVKNPPCTARGTEVVIDTGARTLFLCRHGKADATYVVNLGGGGLGKEHQGDRKTPLGRYPLGNPRASVAGFTWFVPIGYPTDAQAAEGFTGANVGIHGPPHYLSDDVIAQAFQEPWTDGCVMVQTKPEIDAIYAWVRKYKPAFVELLGTPTTL